MINTKIYNFSFFVRCKIRGFKRCFASTKMGTEIKIISCIGPLVEKEKCTNFKTSRGCLGKFTHSAFGPFKHIPLTIP